MKVLFAGPSLYGTKLDLGDIVLRPPACRGDILDATLDGANAIGLIDGNFEAAASVWHKEILYALSQGVAVFGASSMGALRAADCRHFGMRAIGEIANAYADGRLDDDAAVALQHGPPEFDYVPFTVPLVDAFATLDALRESGRLSLREASEIERQAEALHFKDRTIEAMCGRRTDMTALLNRHFFSQKTADALELVKALRQAPDERDPTPAEWRLADSPFWQQMAASRNLQR